MFSMIAAHLPHIARIPGRQYLKYYPFVSREEKMGVNIKYSAI